MNRDDVYKILKAIKGLYPRFEITQESAQMWVKCLKDTDFTEAWENVAEHAKRYKFAPVLAEVRGTATIKRYVPPEEICSVTGREYQLYMGVEEA